MQQQWLGEQQQQPLKRRIQTSMKRPGQNTARQTQNRDQYGPYRNVSTYASYA